MGDQKINGQKCKSRKVQSAHTVWLGDLETGRTEQARLELQNIYFK